MRASARPAGLSDNQRGALWALGAACGFSVNGALVKSLVQLGFDPFQVALFRSVIAFLAVLPFVWSAGFSSLRTRHPWLHVFRVLAGGGATICAVYALAHLRLADVTALSFTTPLFATILAVVIVGERVRWRRWTATAVGFLGVLIMVRPGAGTFEPAALAALGMAFGIAMAVSLVKRLPAAERQASMLFYFGVGTTLLTVGPAILAWRMPDGTALLLLLLMGLTGVASQAMIIRAFRTGEASFVAPFDYAKLLVAGLIGYLLFGEVPDAWTWLGAGVIALATLYILRREAAQNRSLPVVAERV